MEILYISSSGASDPTRASIPWHLAVNGSIEAGQSARIVLAGDATDSLIRATRDGVEGVGVPPLRELVAKAAERSVPVHV
jgi:predicted peroxiredoxin